MRESPALEILSLLLESGADLSYHDPYVGEVTLGDRSLRSVDLSSGALGAADCVLVATDHGCFDYDRVVSEASLIVDTRNATGELLAAEPSLAAKVRRI